MMRLAAFLVVLTTPATADILADLQGLYKWDTGEPAGSCTFVEYDDANFGIEGNTVQWIETTCKLSNPTAVRDMPEGMLYDAVCNGEGDIWSERMFIYQTYAGVAVLSRGAVRTYTRCE